MSQRYHGLGFGCHEERRAYRLMGVWGVQANGCPGGKVPAGSQGAKPAETKCIFYRASIYVRAILGVVILSVCPSVTRMDCEKNQAMHCGRFDTTE